MNTPKAGATSGETGGKAGRRPFRKVSDPGLSVNDVQKIQRRATIRLLSVVALLLVTALFVIDNGQRVEIGYVIGHIDAPLWSVLLAMWALGAAVALLWSWRMTERAVANRSAGGRQSAGPSAPASA